jgi:hypothetical protein
MHSKTDFPIVSRATSRTENHGIQFKPDRHSGNNIMAATKNVPDPCSDRHNFAESRGGLVSMSARIRDNKLLQKILKN